VPTADSPTQLVAKRTRVELTEAIKAGALAMAKAAGK